MIAARWRPDSYRQLFVHVALHGPADAVVRVRLGSLSQVTVAPSFLMYLYCTAVPAGRLTVARQVGYPADESATALAGSQLPSAGVLPTTNTFWPHTVVAFTAKVVATLEHPAGGVVGPPVPVVRAL